MIWKGGDLIAGSDNLRRAKNTKNDEFYTRLEDVASETLHYVRHFKGKTVYMNCDNPEWSNFFRFFKYHFKRFGLKKLITTYYNEDGSSYKLEWTGEMLDVDTLKTTKTPLKGNGDFRSEECVEILKEADIVVTNPPFSLFREYVATLMKYQKQFLILGNMNAITYKEFFPLLKENKVWLGCSSGSKEYMTTEEYAKKNPNKTYQRGGKWYTKLGNTCWFTNLDHAKRHQMIPLDLGYTYYGHEDMYPKYDNYDAINVDRVAQIPCDYEPCWFKCQHATSCRFAQTKGKEDAALCEQVCNGEIGVPISYLDKHCPEQFSIVANGESYSGDGSVADELFVPADSCSHNVQIEKKNNNARYSRESSFASCRKCNGIIGVPISFLDKYCPEQFSIIGITDRQGTSGWRTKVYTVSDSSKWNDLNARSVIAINGAYKQTYARLLIQKV